MYAAPRGPMYRQAKATTTPLRGALNFYTERGNMQPKDFDFIIGSWTVMHRRLKERLTGCQAWVDFSGESTTRKILGGLGNLEDNLLRLPEGDYRAAAFRSYDTKSNQWAIWWLDTRDPHSIDAPVVGEFNDGVGLFYADASLNETAIRVRFTWSVPADGCPRWEQAFSADSGSTWETNWTMKFTRTEHGN